MVKEVRNSAYRPNLMVLGSRDKGLCTNKNVLQANGPTKHNCSKARKNSKQKKGQGKSGPTNHLLCDKFEKMNAQFGEEVHPLIRQTPFHPSADTILDIEDL